MNRDIPPNQKPNIPHLKENEIEGKENVIPERIIGVLRKWGLDMVRSLSNNKEGLKYHDSMHTDNVVTASKDILKFFNNVSKRDEQLLLLAASYHDAVQNWHEKEVVEGDTLPNGEKNPFLGMKKLMLNRDGERNEELSAAKLCEFMDDVNVINDPHIIFTEEDKSKVQKMLMMTVAGYNKEYGTITNGADDGEKHSPIEISLALADLATSGAKSPKEFVEEGDRLFLEENLDIQRLAQEGVASERQKEYIKWRILNWANFQVSFTTGRYKVFKEKELPFFPEDKKGKAEEYFSKYEENIKAVEEARDKRASLNFEELMKIYGIEFTGQKAN